VGCCLRREVVVNAERRRGAERKENYRSRSLRAGGEFSVGLTLLDGLQYGGIFHQQSLQTPFTTSSTKNPASFCLRKPMTIWR